MNDNDVYIKIAEKLGYPDSGVLPDYLKVIMTPEDGELLLELLVPTTCQQLAKRLKVDEKSLQAKLDNLMSRGLLFHGKTEYHFKMGMHGFFNRFTHNKDENIPPEFYDMWNEFRPEVLDREFADIVQMRQNAGVPGNRIVPSRLAIAASPKIRPEQVLWYEDYAELFKRAEIIGVTDCDCRRRARKCDRPLLCCFYINDGCTPDLDPKRDSRLKIISAEEAIALSDIAEEAELLHPTTNNDFSISIPRVLCNCCDDCCAGFIGPAVAFGRAFELLSPSRFLAVVDVELCDGCQECVSKCFFNAIQMRTFTSKKKKAHIINENCMGCGNCVLACKKQKALTLELVRPPEHIPSQQAMASYRRYDRAYGGTDLK